MTTDSKIRKNLPPMVESSLNNLPAEQQATFAAEYVNRRKSLGVGILLLLCFPGFHFFQLGFTFANFILWILFLSTCGGFLIWWLIELFMHPKRIRRHNHSLATDIMKDMKTING